MYRRFPRVETIREDKDSSCCTTWHELQKIRAEGGGKLFGGAHLADVDQSGVGIPTCTGIDQSQFSTGIN